MAKSFNVAKKEGAALGIQLSTPMLIEPQGMGDRFKTEFIGMGRGQFIVARLPRMAGVTEHLYVEKKVTVRYVFQGNVYGFESEVLWTQVTPFRLLFLRYPDTVEILNLRKCQRVDCYLPVKIGVGEGVGEDGGQYSEYEGMILNLSCGGCQLVVDSAPEGGLNIKVDSELTLEFKMVGADKTTRVKGKAKNVNLNKNRSYLGVMFDGVPDEVRDAIENYVSNVTEYLME